MTPLDAAYCREPEKFLNVLYFDDDPVLAAQAYADHHVEAGLRWAVEILSAAWIAEARANEAEPWAAAIACGWHTSSATNLRLSHPGPHTAGYTTLLGQYIAGNAHSRHPCVAWARMYGGNYAWLHTHGGALAQEYALRFEKDSVWLPPLLALEYVPPSLAETELTYCESPVVLPPEYTLSSTIDSYRKWYGSAEVVESYMGLAYTPPREVPSWLC